VTTLPRTDFHSHLVPGVDDGASDRSYSAGALTRFRAEGVGTIITTPHFNGSLTHEPALLAERLTQLDAGWATLEAVVADDAAQFGTPLRVLRGTEVMLDVPEPDLSDARLRLGGGPFVLVEFPGLRLPPMNGAEVAIHALVRAGWRPVIAHPERYRNADESLGEFARCKAAGALLQLNVGSLFGDYGKTAAAYATALLTAGWIDYVSSDYHARGEPGVARFVGALVQSGYAAQAEVLTVTNPGRLVAGEAPLPVAPLQTTEPRPKAPGFWDKMLGPD
jgi:protein-tyrosine phosphatase